MVARPTRKRMYRTMQGRMVDIEKLRATNENVRAIGNMNVNARGDVLGPSGQIVKSKETIMKEYYEQPRGKADDTPAKAKSIAPRRVTIPKEQITDSQIMTPQVKQIDPQQIVTEVFKPKTSTDKKGIDAALDGIE